MQRRKISRSPLRSILAGAASAFILSACAMPVDRFAPTSYSADANQAQHDVYFQSGAATLVSGEEARLWQFLTALALRSDDDVMIRVAATGSDVLDRQRLQVISRAASGTPARVRLQYPGGFSSREARPDSALVIAMRYDRVVVDCAHGALLSAPGAPDPERYAGCSNSVNIAHMAADARDLTAPRVGGPVSSTTAIGAVRRHNEGQINEIRSSFGNR